MRQMTSDGLSELTFTISKVPNNQKKGNMDIHYAHMPKKNEFNRLTLYEASEFFAIKDSHASQGAIQGRAHLIAV